MNQRTYVGLDVHARSNLGCAIDARTGEIKRQRLAKNNDGVVDWVRGPGPPVRVVYEAAAALTSYCFEHARKARVFKASEIRTASTGNCFSQ